MWHFQLQALSEKKTFLKELCIVSAIIHGIAVVALCVVKESEKITIKATVTHDVQVRFVPTLDAHKIQESHKKMASFKGKKREGVLKPTSMGQSVTVKKGVKTVKSSMAVAQQGKTGLHTPQSVPVIPKKIDSQKVHKKLEMISKEKPTTLLQSKTVNNKTAQVNKVSDKKAALSKKVEKHTQNKVEKPLDVSKQSSEDVNRLKKYLPGYQSGSMINALFKKDLLETVQRLSFTPAFAQQIPIVQEKMKKQELPVSNHEAKKIESVVSNTEIKNNLTQHDLILTDKNREGSSEDQVQEHIVYVSPKEYSAQVAHQELQQALSTCWKKPVGIKKSLSADVMIMVDASGVIVKKQFKKNSGVPIYDASIDRALETLTVPDSLKTKTITITFTS